MTPTAVNKRPFSPARQSEDSEGARGSGHEIRSEQAAMRSRVRNQCFDVLAGAVADRESVMVMKDLKDFMAGLTDDALDQARFKNHAEEMREVPKMLDHARNFVRETSALGARVMKEVISAKGDDMSAASMERWRARLKKRKNARDWKEARRSITEFLGRELPKLREDWKKLRSDLHEVQAQAAALGVTGREMPALAALETAEFKNAKFPVRRKQVTAALKALKNRKKSWKKRPGAETEGSRFYGQVRGFLREAADNGWMAHNKIGAWMKRAFVGKSLPDAQRYFRDIVVPFRKNWKEARESYDALHSELKKTGLPRGFTPCAPEDFLQKEYPERLAYVQMLQSRLHPEGKDAPHLSGDIHHAFDAKDWYDAERLIGVLAQQFPSHPDLATMRNYLKSHRDDTVQKAEKKEEPTDREINSEANTLLMRYPEMDVLLTESMRKDTEEASVPASRRTRLVGRMMYNLVWAEERGYTTHEERLQDVEDANNKEKTEEYMVRGHGKGVEKNMVWDTTADESAIREDCSSAQLIFMNSDTDAQLAVFRAVDKMKDNERFGYWSDLVPVTMDPGRHHTFVDTDSKRLKWLMWQMADRGMIYKGNADVSYRHDRKEKAEVKPAPAQKSDGLTGGMAA